MFQNAVNCIYKYIKYENGFKYRKRGIFIAHTKKKVFCGFNKVFSLFFGYNNMIIIRCITTPNAYTARNIMLYACVRGERTAVVRIEFEGLPKVKMGFVNS